jgi:hypothetical protein
LFGKNISDVLPLLTCRRPVIDKGPNSLYDLRDRNTGIKSTVTKRPVFSRAGGATNMDMTLPQLLQMPQCLCFGAVYWKEDRLIDLALQF